MANKTITQLTELTTTPADTDEGIIYDTSVSDTKKWTWANLKSWLKSYFDTLYTSVTSFNSHTSDTSNPHSVTLEQARTAGNILSGDIVTNGNILDAGSGNDIVFKIGDSSGTNKVSILDSSNNEIFNIKSNGSSAGIGEIEEFKALNFYGARIFDWYTSGSSWLLDLSGVGSTAVNYFRIKNSATGSPLNIEATGSDANIDINIVPKGTGVLKENGVEVSKVGHTHTAADITDFDIEVSNNTDVAANTSARHTQNTDTGTSATEFYIDTGGANIPVKSHIQDTSNPHSTSISNLSDTNVATPAAGQGLVYDGTNWVNQDVATQTELDNHTSATSAHGVSGSVVGTSDTQTLTNKTINDSSNDVVTYTKINTQTGTAYTLVLSDAGKLVQMNNSSANTLTIPTNASVAFPIGTKIIVQQYGAGATTISPDTGVTLRDPNSLASISTQYDTRVIIKTSTDEWVII